MIGGGTPCLNSTSQGAVVGATDRCKDFSCLARTILVTQESATGRRSTFEDILQSPLKQLALSPSPNTAKGRLAKPVPKDAQTRHCAPTPTLLQVFIHLIDP